MIGLDTNIIIRIITRDDTSQLENAWKFIQKNSHSSFYISTIVILEVSWVLAAVYKYTKEQVIDALCRLADVDGFIFEAEKELKQALKTYSQRNVDFADCLIGLLNKKNGCEYTVTFDRNAATLIQFKKI